MKVLRAWMRVRSDQAGPVRPLDAIVTADLDEPAGAGRRSA